MLQQVMSGPLLITSHEFMIILGQCTFPYLYRMMCTLSSIIQTQGSSQSSISLCLVRHVEAINVIQILRYTYLTCSTDSKLYRFEVIQILKLHQLYTSHVSQQLYGVRLSYICSWPWVPPTSYNESVQITNQPTYKLKEGSGWLKPYEHMQEHLLSKIIVKFI